MPKRRSYRIRSAGELSGAHAPEELSKMCPRVRCALRVAIIISVWTAAQSATAAVPQAAILPKASGDTPSHPRRNVIIFIADGLRHDSVNATDAPTLLALRKRGVHFV